MGPDKFITSRLLLGWSRYGMANALGCHEETVRQMESGSRHIPPSIEQWLDNLVEYHLANPVPKDWLLHG